MRKLFLLLSFFSLFVACSGGVEEKDYVSDTFSEVFSEVSNETVQYDGTDEEQSGLQDLQSFVEVKNEVLKADSEVLEDENGTSKEEIAITEFPPYDKKGTWWKYRVNNGNIVKIVSKGSVEYEGKNYILHEIDYGVTNGIHTTSENYYTLTDNEFLLHFVITTSTGESIGTVVTSVKYDPPMIIVKKGKGWNQSITMITTAYNGEEYVSTMDSNVVVTGKKTVTTQAGTFDCLILEAEQTIVTMGQETESNSTSYFSEKVGIVNNQSNTYELIGYGIGE